MLMLESNSLATPPASLPACWRRELRLRLADRLSPGHRRVTAELCSSARSGDIFSRMGSLARDLLV